MSDEYQGYTSRETFDAFQWLNTDFDRWSACSRLADQVKDDAYPVSELASLIEEFWDEFTTPVGKDPEDFIENTLPVILDVGSLFRVNWYEIAESFLAV